MVKSIQEKEKEHKLSRLVAGYAWKWISRINRSTPDIVIGNTKLFWNSQISDWVNSPNAINEVGCIHTIQGYDLNYAGVIIGPEISFDPVTKEIVIDRTKYLDANGHRGVADREELKRYIINIYKTLLTRGIKGTYVYIVDEKLRSYVKNIVNQESLEIKPKIILKENIVLSPYAIEMIGIPLVGSAPCGEPLLSETNIEETIMVEKSKIRAGTRYFILLASGDSMNKAGINDGDLVLCRYSEKGETGDRVVALLGGENVTIKYYDKKDGRRILLPKSTNSSYQPIIPDEGDTVQGIVQEVIKRVDGA